MARLEFSSQLLEAAQNDLMVWHKLVNDTEVHDSMLGFHAQQSVEKCLKAVLAKRRVAFRRTHDLAELLDAIADAGLVAPPFADRLDELNPFAVEARYGMGGEQALNRVLVSSWIEASFEWASQTLQEGQP